MKPCNLNRIRNIPLTICKYVYYCFQEKEPGLYSVPFVCTGTVNIVPKTGDRANNSTVNLSYIISLQPASTIAGLFVSPGKRAFVLSEILFKIIYQPAYNIEEARELIRGFAD